MNSNSLYKLFDRSAQKYKPLFIFEMANNHMGDVVHGKKIIEECYQVAKKFRFQFAFKFQFRDMDTFIHPDYKKRTDIKYVKRFSETRLFKEEFKELKKYAEDRNFISICTPFDEKSVDLVEELDFDIIKIASCSLGDWPLMERIVATEKPIIASTAGASVDTIDKVINFLQHREKIFAILHCIGEYPTPESNLQMNQIDFFHSRYPDVVIGFSTHEDPRNTEAIKIAVAKNARIFEKHVGILSNQYEMNAYSATPSQVEKWLKAAKQTFIMGGVTGKRHDFSSKELADLRQFQRGVFAKKDLKKGEALNDENVFYSFPNKTGQIISNDMSKYVKFILKKDVKKNEPIILKMVKSTNTREEIYAIVNDVNKMIHHSRIALPDKLEFEISHHYGLGKFRKYGGVLITCVNREYSKKLVVLLPGQKHPAHYHKMKEETFHILYGDFEMELDGRKTSHKPGEIITVERGVLHSFSAKNGGILEEVSTTHYQEDSFYEDSKINENKNRKTYLSLWLKPDFF